VAEQGPSCPGLYRHLSEHGGEYDAFIAFTYLYAPTVLGLPLVASRSLVVPTAHDEAPFYFDVYGDVFERARALLCLTPEESALIERRFPRHAPIRVVGTGLSPSPPSRPERFAKKFGLGRPYLFYVGRLEAGKGVRELVRYHQRLLRGTKDAPGLVLAGRADEELRGHHVRSLGPISEEDKADGLAGALCTVVPSRLESLSLLALESLAQGTPVLVNGGSDVLRGQVARSGAGRVYRDADSFRRGVHELTKVRASLARPAKAFAQSYSWENVVSAYRQELDKILRGPP
jgi:glycosyltransferase involved in cell wall biosynthesis